MGLDSSYSPFSDVLNKEIIRCVGMVMETMDGLCNSWGISNILHRMIPFIIQSNIPKDTIQHHFWRYSTSHNILLFHNILMITLNHSDILSSEQYENLSQRLLHFSKISSMSSEVRMLSIKLLLDFPTTNQDNMEYTNRMINSTDEYRWNRLYKIAMLLNPIYPYFYPTPFDSVSLKSTKLFALANCFMPSEELSLLPGSDLLSLSFKCIRDYHQHQSSSPQLNILFHLLLLLFLRFPSLFTDLQK